MERLKYVLILFLIFIISCDNELIKDGLPKEKYFFKIVNKTDFNVKIEFSYSSIEGINNDTIKYKQSQIILRPQRFVCAIFSDDKQKEATGGVCDEKRRKTQKNMSA